MLSRVFSFIVPLNNLYTGAGVGGDVTDDASMQLDEILAAIEQEERELIENDLRNIQMARRQLALHATRLGGALEGINGMCPNRPNCSC